MIVQHYIIMKKICSSRWLFFQQSDKETLFWEVFDSLALSSADNTVKHVDLQNALVCSGRFYTSDSYWIIQDMSRAGRIETVGFDTYRKTDSERKWLVGSVEYDFRTRVNQSARDGSIVQCPDCETKGINSGNDHIRRYYKLLEYPNQSIEPQSKKYSFRGVNHQKIMGCCVHILISVECRHCYFHC